MDADPEVIAKLNQQLSGPYMAPPRPVLYAAASLLPDMSAEAGIAARREWNPPTDTGPEAVNGTRWAVMALTSSVLVSVEACSEQMEWDQDSGSYGKDAAAFDARAIPLARVAACRLVELPAVSGGSWMSQAFRWSAKWSIDLVDGSSLEIPWHSTIRNEHEQFAQALIARL